MHANFIVGNEEKRDAMYRAGLWIFQGMVGPQQLVAKCSGAVESHAAVGATSSKLQIQTKSQSRPEPLSQLQSQKEARAHHVGAGEPVKSGGGEHKRDRISRGQTPQHESH